jgi:hypothetical protein
MITSSPGCISTNIAAISSAWVQDGVNNAFLHEKVSSNQRWQLIVKSPSPDIFALRMARVTY